MSATAWFLEIIVGIPGLAFLWFFRPYGWFGQKLHFFGSTCSSMYLPHCFVPETENLPLDSIPDEL